MLTGKELGEAIAQALQQNDKTQADAARFFGVKPPSVTGWIKTGRISKDKLDKLRAWLVLTPDEHWGASSSAVAGIARVSGPASDVVEAMASMGAVPLISWVQAGAWADVADPFQPGMADEWLPCPVAHGPHTYAVRVRGDSMHNPGGRPSYADGDIIFVDPSRDAKHGDRVIVRLDDHAEATFKQLLIEDGRKLLKALNPEWSPRYIPINGNATVCGVVIGKWVPE
jgi:SOS-response transcriptional repressor LexA